jgi:hypothetical protein
MTNRLPCRLRPLFWDHDFARLSWDADRDLIIGRILAVGDWDSLRWLRLRLPDAELRIWLVGWRGAGLSRWHLRFWEVIFHLPRRQVNEWLAGPGQKERDEAYKLQMRKYDFWSQRECQCPLDSESHPC